MSAPDHSTLIARLRSVAEVPVAMAEPLETCCFCNKPIELQQGYERLDASRYCHLWCWPTPTAVTLTGSPQAVDDATVELVAKAIRAADERVEVIVYVGNVSCVLEIDGAVVMRGGKMDCHLEGDRFVAREVLALLAAKP